MLLMLLCIYLSISFLLKIRKAILETKLISSLVMKNIRALLRNSATRIASFAGERGFLCGLTLFVIAE